jgi:hypothetical protein
MPIFFAFSDEAGDYRQFRTPAFRRAHPFYVRATTMFHAGAWRALNDAVAAARAELELPDGEIKWSYLWSLEKHRQHNEEVPQGRDYYFLRNVQTATLQDYIRKCVTAVRGLPGSRVIFTVTDNNSCPRHQTLNILKWHLQEVLQRIQMDMEASNENLCVLFADPVAADRDRAMRDAYAELYRTGDRYKTYSQIKDSLNFEQSHHSVGIQCADFLSGAFSAMLRGYPFGTSLYNDQIRAFIRRGPNDRILGYGARQIPRGRDYQSRLAEVLASHEQPVAV